MNQQSDRSRSSASDVLLMGLHTFGHGVALSLLPLVLTTRHATVICPVNISPPRVSTAIMCFNRTVRNIPHNLGHHG